ncbi:hypothetical protein [Gordonia hydrophobica]|uniref:Uncharacterized protein n=1 Tax=Gordonia hydrophobica TaxID=40516 RepID=A0ABZ2TXY0_9ACTN|nr:hypothetical protein [Gordonia hydrophobica]MBM7366548.1 hypothetical protein [Gordonia hydrophobica]
MAHSGRVRWRALGALAALVVLCVPAVLIAARGARAVVSTSVADAGTTLDDVESWATARHASVSLTVVDRARPGRVGLHQDRPVLTASVAKLFIASQLAFLDATGVRRASSSDDMLLGRMLSASDDSAATLLWQQLGGPALIGEVARRYRLTDTVPPAMPERWWDTHTTVSDVATFYAQLLDERDAARRAAPAGAVPTPSWADRILGPLHAWTDVGADGYDQQFGLPAAFGRDRLSAVKQGWMCCVDARWNHITTGVFGPDDRYIVVVHVAEDVQYPSAVTDLPFTSAGIDLADESAAHARETVTGVVRALFPDMVGGDGEQ